MPTCPCCMSIQVFELVSYVDMIAMQGDLCLKWFVGGLEFH